MFFRILLLFNSTASTGKWQQIRGWHSKARAAQDLAFHVKSQSICLTIEIYT